jgi:hypothetical protein
VISEKTGRRKGNKLSEIINKTEKMSKSRVE